MKYVLSVVLLLSVPVSCDRRAVDPLVSSCTFGSEKLTRTSQFIRDVPATIVAVPSPTSPVVSFQIISAGNSVPLSSCGLPVALAKDSVKVTVSGYFLTFPGMELMNLSPLPFEVTEARLRE